MPVAVDDDLDEARNALRPLIAFYLGGMGAKDKNFYVDLLAANGLADEAHEVQDRFLAGDRIGAAMALSSEVIDMCGIACTPGRPREAGRPLRRLRRRLDDRDRLRLRPRRRRSAASRRSAEQSKRPPEEHQARALITKL